MTVKDLRTLVDNLDEYIHVPGGIERLKKTILHLAVSGQLVPQDPSEGTGQELYSLIQTEKSKLVGDRKLKKQVALSIVSDDEVPFTLPSNWAWVRLGEIIQVSSGSFLPSSEMSDDFDYPAYGGNGISGYYSKFLHEEQVIVIGRVGARCGNVHVTQPKSWVTDNAFVARYIENFMSRDYLVLALRQLNLKLTHKGSAQPVISGRSIYPLPFQLPPLAEQGRIIEKVNNIFFLIDELSIRYKDEQDERHKLVIASLNKFSKREGSLALDQLTEIIKTKEDAAELRKTILHLAVSGQLVPQNASEGTGKDLYGQIQIEKAKLVAEGKLKKQKPLPETSEDGLPFAIPANWKWVRLQDVGKIVGGGTPPSSNSEYYTVEHDDSLSWITPADLRGFKNLYISHGARSITSLGLSNSSAQLLPKGTVLFSSRAPIGHLAIALNEITTNQGFKSIVPHSEMSSEYIYRWLQYYGPTIDANASGTTFREVSGAIVSLQPIPLPPAHEQAHIAKKVTELFSLVSKLENHLEKR